MGYRIISTEYSQELRCIDFFFFFYNKTYNYKYMDVDG